MKNEISEEKPAISLINQYMYERTTWNRILDCMQEENIHSKNRLSAILKKNNIDGSLVERMESFLNKFVLEDSKISILRRYISEANNKLTAIQRDSELIDSIETIGTIQNKLRREIKERESEFNELKSEFNKYLLHHFETNK